MRKGLFLPIAGVLLVLYFMADILETQINSAPVFLQRALLILVTLVVIGAALLAMWDTKVIGKK